MSISEALLAAIRESPDDDLPRLAYADWLEENGDPQRAEFIHVQIERARLPDGDGRDAELAGREEALYLAGCELWESGFPDLEGIQWGNLKAYSRGLPLSRGFVETARAESLAAFEREETRIRATIPLSGLILDARRGETNLTCGGFAGLSDLTVTGERLGDEEIISLAGSPQLANLHRLAFGTLQVTPKGAAALTHSAHLARVRELLLYEGGDRIIRALSDAPLLPNLVRLELSGRWVCPEVTGLLASWPANLRRLTISQAGGNNADVLARTVSLAGLLVLEMIDLSVGAAGAAALAASDVLAGLAVLSLHDNPALNDEGVRELVTKPRFRPHTLHLGRVRMGPTGVTSLLASPLMPSLRTLSLANNPIRDQGVEILGRSSNTTGLVCLDLSYTGLTDAAALALARSQHLGALKDLCLYSNACIGERGTRALRERFGDALRI